MLHWPDYQDRANMSGSYYNICHQHCQKHKIYLKQAINFCVFSICVMYTAYVQKLKDYKIAVHAHGEVGGALRVLNLLIFAHNTVCISHTRRCRNGLPAQVSYLWAYLQTILHPICRTVCNISYCSHCSHVPYWKGQQSLIWMTVMDTIHVMMLLQLNCLCRTTPLLQGDYGQTCLKRPLKGPKNVVSQDRWSLNTGELQSKMCFWGSERVVS